MVNCRVPKDAKRAVKDLETLERQVRRARKLVLDMETKLAALVCEVRVNDELHSRIKPRKSKPGPKRAA